MELVLSSEISLTQTILTYGFWGLIVVWLIYLAISKFLAAIKNAEIRRKTQEERKRRLKKLKSALKLEKPVVYQVVKKIPEMLENIDRDPEMWIKSIEVDPELFVKSYLEMKNSPRSSAPQEMRRSEWRG